MEWQFLQNRSVSPPEVSLTSGAVLLLCSLTFWTFFFISL